jgi:hypothetical protein
MLFTSCKKQEVITEDFIIATVYYRLAMIDKDSSVKYSNIVATKTKQVSILDITSESNSESDDDDDEDDDDEDKASTKYCKKNPNSIRCKTLPVILEYFRLDYVGERFIRLKWKSTDETNFSRYSLERSRDAKTFKPIADIKAKGPSEYTYTDQTR